MCLCRKRKGGYLHPLVFDKATHTIQLEGVGGHKDCPYR